MRRYGIKHGLLALLLLAVLLVTIVSAAAGSAAAEGTDPAEAEEVRMVEAATVDELLEAIAPNTTITLTGRSYDLTRAQGYGVYGSGYYIWNEVYDDGWELEIDNVQNLTICAGRTGTELVTVPRYACVLKFVNCANVTLEGFTAGHTDGPGYCTGAVLHMEGCRNMTVKNCDLYGCGTYGLELEHSSTVHAYGTTIRDCSYGALWAANCTDVLLDDCSVHGIDGYEGVFSLRSCRDCAVINTLVRDNASASLVSLNSSRNFYMAGCEVSKNRFIGMFFCAPYPLTMEGCQFTGNECEYGWYQNDWRQSERVVAPDGHIYTDEELGALGLLADAVWSPAENQSAPVTAPKASADGMIHVHNVDELLASIAPETTIYLEDGVYNLSDSANYGTDSGDYWYWMDCYDGPGLVIQGVENFSITAAGPHRARIVAEPRYCDVLSFEGCVNVSLSNFTAGHTQAIDDGGCAGGVLSFMDCRDTSVEDCSLYGCGILGISFSSCLGAEVVHTEIHDCSNGALFFYDSRDIAVSACNIHDIPNALYQVYDCRNITVDGEALPEGSSW